jgi:hydroxypyruvate reductase
MKPEILFASPTHPHLVDALQANYTVHVLPVDGPERATVLDRVAANVRLLVTTTLVGADARLIGALPKLECIVNAGGHVDKIDHAAAAQRHIAVTNTPGVYVWDVADTAMGLIFAVQRRLLACDALVRSADWKPLGFPRTRRVSGRRAGIVGLGLIGREFARRAEGFRMEVGYFGRGKKADVPYPYFADLKELAAWCDCLVLTCSSGPETRHLVNADVLKALGPEGIVVNVARGTVIDEAAMVDALERGLIGGAGLDVFEHEPDVPAKLLASDKVVLMPHVASNTDGTRNAQAVMAIANIEAHFAGKPLPNRVTGAGH